jgi:hypothetical protein
MFYKKPSAIRVVFLFMYWTLVGKKGTPIDGMFSGYGE